MTTTKSNAADIIAAASAAKEELAVRKEQEKSDALSRLADVKDLDWTNLPPPVVAMILTQIPQKGKRNEPDWFMTPWHALVYAMRCAEMGVSPFSKKEAFPMLTDYDAHLTLEGKMRVCRKEGMNIGPPKRKWVERPWKPGREILGADRKPISDQEPGCTTTVSVRLPDGRIEPAEYTAWLTEWSTGSGQWEERPLHMLQIRSHEKAISSASGVGVSAMPDEKELDGEQPAELSAAIDVQVPKLLRAPKPFLKTSQEETNNESV